VIGGDVVPGSRAWLAGVAAWCAVVLPWGLAFLWRVGLETACGTFRREVLERYFAEDAPHGAPAWYYLGVVAIGFFPWAATLVLGVARAWKRRRDPAARTAAYAAAGLVVGLAFFTIGRGKLPSYVLPLAPLAAIVVAWEIGQEIADPPGRRRGQFLAATSLGIVALALALEAIGGVGNEFHAAVAAGAVVLGTGTAAAFVGIRRRRAREVHLAVAASALLFTAVAAALAFPVVGAGRSTASLIREVPELRSGRPVIAFEKQLPSLCFYLDTVPEWRGVAQVAERISKGDRPLVVVHQKDLSLLPPDARDAMRGVGSSGRYLVFEPRVSGPQ
jgi:4-amino-4-deoxy-L-arabinose transferase-like glycosyltransferase